MATVRLSEESAPKFTPGPWRKVSAGMVEMGDPGSRLSFWAGLGHGGQVPNPSGQDPRVETEANARLIAAAPALYHALDAQERAELAWANCELCWGEGEWSHCPSCSLNFGRAIDKRRAALSSARGEQGK